MASCPKKSRTDQSFTTICIRLCDSFQRTQQKIICPFIRAEESVRVLYKVQQESLKNVLTDAGKLVGLELMSIKWCPLPGEKNRLDGNIFIDYKTSTKQWDENTFIKYKNSLTLKLSNFNVRNVFVDQACEESTLSQPIIKEIDYKITELDSRFQNYLHHYQNQAEPDTIPADLENIRTLLKELKEGRIQIALLSHNDVGKSFLLNLLLLLTAENTRTPEEKKIKLPQDLIGNPTIKEVTEGEFEDLPEAIKDFLDEITDDEQDFKNMVQPICHVLPFTDQEELRKVEESYRGLSEYHTHQKRVDLEPFLLPQKDAVGSYNTTTNCVFHLRYGSSFQAQVKYFEEKELQDQLFELVLLENGSAETRTDLVNKKMLEKSRKLLMARFRILTENLHTSTNEKEETRSVLRAISSPEDVRLCEQVRKFAGKTELHIGNGKNSAAQDRLALQKLLKEFTLSDDYDEDASRSLKQKIAALKSLVVYVPSILLYGGAEILELPGTNDSDPLAMGFIQDALDKVDSVLLLLEFGFRIAGQEVKDCLKESDFIKKWKNKSCDYKLMFLSYPEKNYIYQFGESDCMKIENIGKEEPSKKSLELQNFEEILHPDCLTADMEKNISSYTLLPVLHSSIHALEGEPHHILQKKGNFLKYTGIDLLTTELDQIIMQKKKNIIEEIEKKLEDFETCHRDKAGDGPEDDSSPTAQEMNFDQETKFLKKNEDLFNKLKKKHEELIKDSVDGSLKSLLQRSVKDAVSRWTEIESDITDAAIFNPQYSGRHAAFKRKMDDILFGDLDKEILPIFSKLTENVHDILYNYKKMAIELFTKEFKNKTVKPATVGRSLECALGWFLGTTRASFNERTLMKSFQELFEDSMKKHILGPSYRDSIESTRRNMKNRIQDVLCELQKSFLQATISFYNEKWPENLAKFMVRSCISVDSARKSQAGSTFCGKLRCSMCNHIESTTTFTSTKKRKIYQITEHFTCNTANVIYLITCKKCKKQYVGQTVQAIGRRFTDHLSRIKCNNDMLVSQHFNTADHSVHDISLVVIEKVEKGKSLLEREQYWIKELGTLKPAGLNGRL